MPVIRYVFSVLLYLLMLPISTPAAFVVSTWTRPDDLDWGGWFVQLRFNEIKVEHEELMNENK